MSTIFIDRIIVDVSFLFGKKTVEYNSGNSFMKIQKSTKSFDFMQKYDKIVYSIFLRKEEKSIWHSYGVDVLQKKRIS